MTKRWYVRSCLHFSRLTLKARMREMKAPRERRKEKGRGESLTYTPRASMVRKNAGRSFTFKIPARATAIPFESSPRYRDLYRYALLVSINLRSRSVVRVLTVTPAHFLKVEYRVFTFLTFEWSRIFMLFSNGRLCETWKTATPIQIKSYVSRKGKKSIIRSPICHFRLRYATA